MARNFSGRRLRDARIAARLKPEQLAFHIGRSVYSVHSYEAGRALPSVSVLGSIADVLGVATDALFGEATADAS